MMIMKTRLSQKAIWLALIFICAPFLGNAREGWAQDLKVVVEGPPSQSVYVQPPGAKPVITRPNCQSYPYRNRLAIYSYLWHPQGKKIGNILGSDIRIEWSGNSFNASVFTSSAPCAILDVELDDKHQDISRTSSGNVFYLKAASSHLPITETLIIKGSVGVEFSDGTAAEAKIDEKREFYFHPCGQSGQPPAGQAGPCLGNEISAGNCVFVWTAPGTLSWKNSPQGEIAVDQNVPSAAAAKAIETSSGPLVIYQTGKAIRYKMYSGLSGDLTADGNAGQGNLKSVAFRPGLYGSRALIQAQSGGQVSYYMFIIDQWGNAGTTSQVGGTLSSNLSHMAVQYRSALYLFEFNPANGTLTCKDNFKGWTATIDTGIDGLIVPAATGGGAVVVYSKQNTVYSVLLFWTDGSQKEKIVLGSGTLLSADYTLQGPYGANGTALIRTSQNAADNVAFAMDIWGSLGTTGIIATHPSPAGGLPADPPAGFAGGGALPAGDCGSAADYDRDGFSDEYETKAGTDPCSDSSKPSIDLSIVLLLDKSGTMATDNKMEDAKTAAISSLANLNKTTEIGVIAYSGGCEERFPAVAEFSQDSVCLTQAIESIQPGGGTPMSPALFQAEEFLRKSAHGKRGLIVLLCGGQNECQPNETEAAKQIFQHQAPAKVTQIPEGHRFLRTMPGKSLFARLLGFLAPPAEAASAENFFQEASQVSPPQPTQEEPPAQEAAQTQKGGPDSIPPGQSPPEIVPEMLDASKGGMNNPPEGTPAPQNLAPVEYTDSCLTIAAGPEAAGPQAENIQMGVQISTIGFGLQNNPLALQALASVAQFGGGRSYDAQNLQRLTEVFNQAITQSPGFGGGVFISPSSKLKWPLVAALAFVLGSLILLVSILVIRRRGAARPGRDRGGLDVLLASGWRQSFRLKGSSVTIGRDVGNDVVVDDPEVSSRHVQIFISQGGYLLRDLGSTNGTSVNGQRISETYIYVGDEIKVGNSTIYLTP
jgi:hypothetical protein